MSLENIRLFVPTYDVDECLREIRECFEIGWTGSGYKTDQFEKKWTEQTKLQNSLFLNSNSIGLEIALAALKIRNKWQNGDEIITTPLTFVSTNHAIVRCDLNPIFCDVDESLNLDPARVKAAITSRTRAIMFVGIGGNPANYEEIVSICKENRLALILDAAHMVGTANVDGFIGQESDFVVSSFQAVKNLPTADSGMLNSPDEELSIIARKLSWLGISTSTYERNNGKGGYKWEYDVDYVGYKANGNSIMASVGLAQLPRLESDNAFRRDVSSQYRNALSIIEGLKIVHHDESQYRSARHLFQIRILAKSREKFVNTLNNLGIDVGVHYRLNTRYAPYLKYAKEIPNAEKFESELVSLPLHLRLSSNDVERVITAIKMAMD